MCRFAKMILRDRRSTSYDLASIFRGRRSTLDRWTGKNRKTHWYESVSSALNFAFLKDVSQNSSFLMSCTSKNEEVSQNCFVSDVVKFKNEDVSQNCSVLDVLMFKHDGSLAEFLCF